MKRYIRSANWLTNKATQLYSKKFDENEILVRALLGQHKGSPMLDVFFNIMSDPNVTIEDPGRAEGAHTIFLNGKNVGWLDFQRGMGWIDDKAYNKIQQLDSEQLAQLRQMWTRMIIENRMGDDLAAIQNPMGEEFDTDLQYDDEDDFGGYLE